MPTQYASISAPTADDTTYVADLARKGRLQLVSMRFTQAGAPVLCNAEFLGESSARPAMGLIHSIYLRTAAGSVCWVGDIELQGEFGIEQIRFTVRNDTGGTVQVELSWKWVK